MSLSWVSTQNRFTCCLARYVKIWHILVLLGTETDPETILFIAGKSHCLSKREVLGFASKNSS